MNKNRSSFFVWSILALCFLYNTFLITYIINPILSIHSQQWNFIAIGLDTLFNHAGILFWILFIPLGITPSLYGIYKVNIKNNKRLSTPSPENMHYDEAINIANTRNIKELVHIGYDISIRKREIYLQTEDSCTILGLPRSGKTRYLANRFISRAPGFLLCTSTKRDTYLNILNSRKDTNIKVLDLTNSYNIPSEYLLAWNILEGCKDYIVAEQRGYILAKANTSKYSEQHWSDNAANILSLLFYTAAISDKSIKDVYLWLNSDFKEPLKTLKHIDNVMYSTLKGIIETKADKELSSILSTTKTALKPLINPVVMEKLMKSNFKIDNKSTICVLSKHNDSTSSFVSIFLEHVIYELKSKAQKTDRGYLNPSARLVLDEIANIAKLNSLDNLMSDSGGRGITSIILLQSLQQLRTLYGHDKGNAIYEASTAKLILGGMSNIRDLRDIQELIGKKSNVFSNNPNKEYILEIDDIYGLARYHGLLIYRNQKPIEINIKGKDSDININDYNNEDKNKEEVIKEMLMLDKAPIVMGGKIEK